MLYHYLRFEFILKVTHFLFVQLIRTIKEFEPPAFGINSFINSEKSASIFPLSKQSLFEKFLHQNVRFMNYSLESNDTFMWNSYCGCMKWCSVQWTHVTHIYYWLDFETLSNNNSIVPRIFIRVFQVQFIVKAFTRNETTWIQLIKWFLLPNFSSLIKIYYKIQGKF